MATNCIYCGSEEVEEIEPGDWYISDVEINPEDFHTMECQNCANVFLVRRDLDDDWEYGYNDYDG